MRRAAAIAAMFTGSTSRISLQRFSSANVRAITHVDDDWGFDLEVTYKALMRRARRLSGWSTWADGLGHWDAQ